MPDATPSFPLRLRRWFASRGPGGWLLLFCGLAVLLRWGTFFISVINHDESTYIVIADELLRGEVYFRDVIDTKPIGIFWIYAGLIKLTGGAIPMLRLGAALFVGGGAWGLYLGARRALGSNSAGIVAGVAYCWMCSVFTYYGLSPNAEIFFNLFTIGAVALAVAPRAGGRRSPFWHWPVAGLLLGTAFVIKPFAAAEAGAIGLFLVWYYARAGRWGRMLVGGASLIGAFMLSPVLSYLYFVGHDVTEAFWFYTVEVSGAYPVELAWYLRLKYVGDYLLRYAPFVILAGAAGYSAWRRGQSGNTAVVGDGPAAGAGEVARKQGGEQSPTPEVQLRWQDTVGQLSSVNTTLPPSPVRTWWTYLMLQFVFVLIVVLLTGKRFGHYQVQLHPVLAALAACWYAHGRPLFPRWNGAWVRKYTPTGLLVLSLLMGLQHFNHYRQKDDLNRRMATWLSDHLGPDETFFCLSGGHVAYHLTDRPVPTPYVHNTLLFFEHHLRAFQIDEATEASRLLADPTVVYLTSRRHTGYGDNLLRRTLLNHFELVDTIPGNVEFYRRMED